jgi:uncharacterized protein (TIGR01777 family)
MKIVISGGTGFIGSALVQALLKESHSVVVLTRNPKKASSDFIHYEAWNGISQGMWSHTLEDADAIINLAGESLAERLWTQNQKQRIVASRIDATRALVESIARVGEKPHTFINASAVGYYGNVREGEVTEESPRGEGFLADVCHHWEREAFEAEKLGTRVVVTRFGLVMEKDGGMLRKLLLPFRFFAGVVPGSGRQWVSWVHRDDVIGAILFALSEQSLSGPVNVVAPEPVRMGELCHMLAQVLRRPCWMSMSPILIRLALGEMGSIVLDGQKVAPRKLERRGYRFKHPTLPPALESILR